MLKHVQHFKYFDIIDLSHFAEMLNDLEVLDSKIDRTRFHPKEVKNVQQIQQTV